MILIPIWAGCNVLPEYFCEFQFIVWTKSLVSCQQLLFLSVILLFTHLQWNQLHWKLWKQIFTKTELKFPESELNTSWATTDSMYCNIAKWLLLLNHAKSLTSFWEGLCDGNSQMVPNREFFVPFFSDYWVLILVIPDN